MNERIKELYKQADINIDSFQFSGTPIKYIVSESSLEKFAMLIINECYNRAEGEYHHSGDEWDKGVMAVMNSIEELFGVEQ